MRQLQVFISYALYTSSASNFVRMAARMVWKSGSTAPAPLTSSPCPCPLILYLVQGWQRIYADRLGFIPVFARLELHFDRNVQIDVVHMLHLCLDEALGLVELFDRDLKHKLIVDLQNHTRLHARACKSMLDAQHGHLDQVGIRALDGHVDSFTLQRLALAVREGLHVREETLAAIQCVDVALQTRLVEGAVDVALDAREGFVIASDKFGRLGIGHSGDLRQAVGRLAVEDGVDDGLGQPALLSGDLGDRDAKERGSR